MKKVFLFMFVMAVVMFFSASSILAAEETLIGQKVAENKPEPMFSASGEIWVKSAYVGDMTGGISYRGLVIQPMVTISHNPSGLYVGAWGSYAPGKNPTSDNAGDNYGNEVDLFVGITQEFGPVKVDLSYLYFNMYNLNEWGEGDGHSFTGKVDWAINKIVVPYVTGTYYHMIEHSELDGFAYRVGTVLNLHEHLKINLSVAGHGKLFGAKEEPISSGRISISSPWKLGAITIIPEIAYQQRFGYESTNDGSGLTESILYAGVGATF